MSKKRILLSENQKKDFIEEKESNPIGENLKKTTLPLNIEFRDSNGIKQIIHLNKEALLNHLNNEYKEQLKIGGESRKIRSLKTRITKVENNYELENSYHLLFERYTKEHQISFLTQAIYLTSLYAQNKSKGSVYSKVLGLKYFLEYMDRTNKKLNNLEDITRDFMIRFSNDISSANNFNKSFTPHKRRKLYSTITNLLRELWKITNKSFKIPTIPKAKTEARKAYSIKLSKQIYAAAWLDIQEIIKNKQKYDKLKNKYIGQDFYSLKNVAYTYLMFKGTAQGSYKTLNTLERISTSRHNISLKETSIKELEKISTGGQHINKFPDEETVVWFLESVLPDFPYKGAKLSDYTSYFSDRSLSNIFNGYKALELLNKVISYKIPFRDNVYPFFLFFLASTGKNIDVLKTWKWIDTNNKQEVLVGDEKFPLDSSQRIIWGEKKKSKKFIMTVLDTKEKNGLWSMLIFLRKFLKKNTRNPYFWNFISIYDYFPADFKTHSLRIASELFCKKHNITDKNNKILEYIEHLRLRSTRVAIDIMRGKSLEKIKETILNHKSIDTIAHYTNSDDIKELTDNTIYAIQENMFTEASKFQGNINRDNVEGTTFPAYSNSCNNPFSPGYTGAQRLKENHICTSYDLCIICPNANVFEEHIPKVIERTKYYKKQINSMQLREWEVNYGELYEASLDCLRRHLAESNTNPILRQEIKNLLKEEKKGDFNEVA